MSKQTFELLLDKMESMLSAAEEDVYGADNMDEGKRAAAKRAAKIAMLKEGMAGLDDEGRAEMKKALMDSTGDEPVGARNTSPDGGVKGAGQDWPPAESLDDEGKEAADDADDEDDLDIDIDLDDGELKRGSRQASRKGAALAAAVKEVKSLRKRLGRLEAAENRARSRPLIDRMLKARAEQGMPESDLVAYGRKMLSASYREVRERYDDEAVLLGHGPAVGAEADYATALIGSGPTGRVVVPFNGEEGGQALQASVSELLDVGGSKGLLGGKTMEEALSNA